MGHKNKQLLLQDLTGRLPYSVIVQVNDGVKGAYDSQLVQVFCDRVSCSVNVRNPLEECICIDSVKPYLRPLSSMTEEEREDFWKNVLDIDWRELEFDEEPDEVPFPFTENDCGFYLDFIYLADLFAVFDWLNARHFDYRGLIPKGLALVAPKGMYENNTDLK